MPIKRDDLATTDFSDIDSDEQIPRTLPGDVLRHEFMEPLGLTAYALGREINVPANRIAAIVKGERAISAETAILLGRRFGTSAEFWMNLQTAHDLEEAGYKTAIVRSTLGELAARLVQTNLDVRKGLHKQMDVIEAGRIHMRVDGKPISIDVLVEDLRRRLDSVEKANESLMHAASNAGKR